MSQISPPIRIVLAAALAFMAAWFVFLRPGTEPVAPTQPAAAPASGFGKAVKGAENATAAANAASAAAAAQTGASAPAAASKPGTTAATGGNAAPAADASKSDGLDLGLPMPVAKAVAKKQTLVMLFWNKRAFDDQAVRHELRHINRHKGKVKVHVASIGDVARYQSITRGVNLEQSPTVVVAKGSTADALVGFVDRGTINQAVSDVMRSTAPKKKKQKK